MRKRELPEHHICVTLSGGGFFTLTGRFDWFKLSDEERELITTITDLIRQYQKEQARKAEARAEAQPVNEC